MTAISNLNKQKSDVNRGVGAVQNQLPQSESSLFDEFSQILDKIASKIGRGDQGSAVSQVLGESQFARLPLVAAPQAVTQAIKHDHVVPVAGEMNPKGIKDLGTDKAEDESEKNEASPDNEDREVEKDRSTEGKDEDSAPSSIEAHDNEAATSTVSEAASTVVTGSQKECAVPAEITAEGSEGASVATEGDLAPFEETVDSEVPTSVPVTAKNAVTETQVGDAAASDILQTAQANTVDGAAAAQPVAKNETIDPTAQTDTSPATQKAGEVSETEALIKAITKQLEAKIKESTETFASVGGEHAVASMIGNLVRDTVSNNQVSVKASLEQMVMKVGEVKGASATGIQSFQGGEGALSRGNISLRGEEVRSRPLPRAASTATMERVETALKEVAKSRDGKTISVRLDPPDLGAVKIDVTMRDGGLHARLMAENSQVSQLLKDRASDLQTTLRKLGLNVDSVTVSVLSEENGRNTSEFTKDHGKGSEKKGAKSFESGEQGSVLNGALSGTIDGGARVYDHWVA